MEAEENIKASPGAASPAAVRGLDADGGTIVMRRDSRGMLIPGAPLDASAMQTLKLDGYEFLSKLGHGGVGDVYLARQISLDRYVAVKVIRTTGKAVDAYLANLRGEALTMATLSHPNIVDCHDIIKTDAGLFLVMEYIRGHMTARDMVEHLGPVPSHIMTRLLLDLAKGLAYIYERGFLHRDLKPANLMILHSEDNAARSYWKLFGDAGTRIVICDFGIAKSVAVSESSERVVGSPMYMSPEQARGESSLDCRSDIYSLGCVAYFMLTGQVPFEQPDQNSLMAHKMCHGVPDPRSERPEVSSALSRIVQKMGRADASARYSGYGELIGELEELVAEESEWFARSEGRLRRQMKIRLAVYTALLLALCQSGWLFYDNILRPYFQPVQMSLSKSMGFWFDGGPAGWTHVMDDSLESGDFMRARMCGRHEPLVLMQMLKDGMAMDFNLRFFGTGKVACGFLMPDMSPLMTLEWTREAHKKDKLRLLCGEERVTGGFLALASQFEWAHITLKLDGDRIVATVQGKSSGTVFVEDMPADCYFYVDAGGVKVADIREVFRVTEE